MPTAAASVAFHVALSETDSGALALDVRSHASAGRELLGNMPVTLHRLRAVIESLEIRLCGEELDAHLLLGGLHGRPLPVEARGAILSAVVEAVHAILSATVPLGELIL